MDAATGFAPLRSIADVEALVPLLPPVPAVALLSGPPVVPLPPAPAFAGVLSPLHPVVESPNADAKRARTKASWLVFMEPSLSPKDNARTISPGLLRCKAFQKSARTTRGHVDKRSGLGLFEQRDVVDVLVELLALLVSERDTCCPLLVEAPR